MMSPDPPREERNNSEGDGATGSGGRVAPDFVAVWDDMDDDELMFVPEGPHELDLGGTDSEYSDTSDEEGVGELAAEAALDNPPVEGSHARGFYQLLIPFPVSQQLDDSSELSEGHQDNHLSSEPDVLRLVNENHPPLRIDYLPEELTSAAEKVTVEKREIELTEEKVETIKSVMKSFSLPPNAIPSWASELDEDSWKIRLSDTIQSKSSSKSFKS